MTQEEGLLSISVFTVPMRNWNWCTSSPGTYLPLVFTVPMRNWNWFWERILQNKMACFYSTYEELKRQNNLVNILYKIVFTVPMRNWNSNILGISFSYAPSVFTVPMRNWNLSTPYIYHVLVLCFYSTYEELKQLSYGKQNSHSLQVFTVPMRNWNSITLSFNLKLKLVFTVPMRNWNTF